MKQDLILCQITSKKTNPDIYCVEISNNETINGTLSIDSLVRCNMIFTADKKQIIKKICKVSEKKYKEIIEKIISIIQ
jgi:mRNA-degrading endonuclease toxin of MazEF toxin-antitoxin module